MNNTNQLKVGAILSYISLISGNLISILYTPIMLRLLGQSEYGLYNLSNSFIGYLGVLDFGLGNAVIKYTAQYRAIQNKEKEANLYGMFFLLYSLLSLLIIISGIFLVVNSTVYFSNTLSSIEVERIKILMIIMISNLAISLPFGIFNSIIIAYEHFVFPKLLILLRQIFNPLLTLPLLLKGYGSIGLASVSTLLNILIILFSIYYCFRKLNIKIRFNKLDFNILKEIFGYSFFIFITMIADKIYWGTDQFILGALVGSASVAIYSIGATINSYYMGFSTAISGVFLPKITRMVTGNCDDSQLSNLFIRTGRLQFITMSFILGGFILVGREFIKIWAGVEYSDSYYIAIIIMIPFTIDLIQNTGIAIMQAKNKNRFRAFVLLGIGLINIFISIPLAKIYGGIGCAISTSLSLLIGNIMINFYYHKKIKLDIPHFWMEIMSMAFPFILALSISWIISSIISLEGMVFIFINGIVYILLFILFMWKLSLNTSEKELFLSPFNFIIKKICSFKTFY